MAKWARIYRTYQYLDKNPVVDRVRTIVQDEGLFTKLSIVHELSNVSKTTLHGWFHGSTRNPQHHTIAAVVTALGYEEQFVKKKELNVERERKAAAEWTAKQTKRPKKRSSK